MIPIKPLLAALGIVFTLAFSISPPVFAVNSAKEYEIKAAFLFNLGSFVRWSERSFEGANAPFYLCVLGDDPFGDLLDTIAAGQNISGHPMKIQRFQDIAESMSIQCNTLFISLSVQAQLPEILAHLKDQPTLTVGDMDNFAVQGGMVQFFTRDNKVRLMLDPQAFAEAGLRPSAQLMRIAQIVNGK